MNPLLRQRLLAIVARGLAATASPEYAVRAAHDHERRWEIAVAEASEASERVEDQG